MVSSWDGWKALLKLDEILPKGVSLPPPNPDPRHVPTPPKATLSKVSPRGVTTINFSKEVFVYENLKNKTVPEVPSQAPKRILKNVGLMKVLPFVEIKVLSGEQSDPSKLTFDYRIEFIDSKTIEIEIEWLDPAYVSANQPEETLVVKLNGPFFDRQDGLDVEFVDKTLSQKIPPQLTKGVITDAI